MTRGIRQRSTGSWQITVYTGRRDSNGRYQRIIATVKGTKRQAEQKRAELLTEIRAGTYRRPSRERVVDFLRRWLASEKNLTPRSRLRYKAILEQHVVPHVGALLLDEIDPGHLQELDAAWSRSGLHKNTLRLHHAVVHRAFTQAMLWRLVARDLLDGFKAPSEQTREYDVLDQQQLAALLDALDEHEYRIAFRLLVHTAMREGEVLGLRWRDVDLESGVARVAQQYTKLGTFTATKEHRGVRPIDLDSTIVGILRAHRPEQNEARLAVGSAWQQHDLIVCDGIGVPITHSQLYHAFKSTVAKVGLPKTVRPHDVRHTHASHLLAMGTDLKVIQERLGHSSPAYTLRKYGHVLPGRQREAAERFAAGLRPARPIHETG